MTIYIKVKKDNNINLIQNLKGGNVFDLPSNEDIIKKCPKNIPMGFWNKICTSYNLSQIWAIKYVSENFNQNNNSNHYNLLKEKFGIDYNDLMDTKIALIQGPPGTGKTHTVTFFYFNFYYYNIIINNIINNHYLYIYYFFRSLE